MADLDDFFAKKDKKKKGTKKFSKANTDVIAKNLEETAKKELKAQEKLEPLATSAALNEENKTETKVEDDEWEVYREDKKDYTGLKIETLKVEEEPEEEEAEEQMNEDGEMVTVKKEESGPWNKKAGTNNNTEEKAQQEEKTPEPDHTAPAPAPARGYVPPHLRGGNVAADPSPGMGPRRPMKGRNRAAPDINSEVYFPSLSSTADDCAPKGAWGKKLEKRDEGQFEEVRERQGQTHSSRSAEAPKLILGNRFEGLRDDD